MSCFVKSCRWVLLCLYLATHFSTLSAKSRALWLFLTDSKFGWASATELSTYSLESVDTGFPNPMAKDSSADRTNTWQETISNQDWQNTKWKYFCHRYLLKSLLHPGKYTIMLPISLVYSSHLVLSKLPGISPACNFDLYWVIRLIFSHLRNTWLFWTPLFLDDWCKVSWIKSNLRRYDLRSDLATLQDTSNFVH